MKKLNPIKTLRRVLKTDSGKVAYKKTIYVLKVFLSIYIPLIALCVVLFIKYNYMSLPVWLLVILSSFPFTKYMLIPLLGKKEFSI